MTFGDSELEIHHCITHLDGECESTTKSSARRKRPITAQFHIFKHNATAESTPFGQDEREQTLQGTANPCMDTIQSHIDPKEAID